MYIDSESTLGNSLRYPCSVGTLRGDLAGGLQEKAKGSAAFELRKAFCLAYVQVLSIHCLLCMGISGLFGLGQCPPASASLWKGTGVQSYPELWAASGFGGEAVTLILCDMI